MLFSNFKRTNMSKECVRCILVCLSILLIANGVVVTLAYWTAPKITIITNGPGQPVIFRIHFYIVDYEGTWNSWTVLNDPSVENHRLLQIRLPGAQAPAIRVWDPDGIEYQWVGSSIIVDKGGAVGGDENIYVDIVFDPNNQNGWSNVPVTSKPGLYKVDFDGLIFLINDGQQDGQPFQTELYFDILHRFYVPEMPSISVALVLSGLTMLVLRKRLVK